ncbi:GumC family protein [Adhaeribacter soli]|uniref:non-specific protein-tyrosine kinase n=1 Tax=Adhaeribacter soli TaxID=2607655 RepID=A0A5N1J695_9BACT|nr:polysaccharide biosynthesis tyrosine autokinase [Adhaeribacter soli]KAA9340707.1 polysaccharide biosynthesis tyrosine autokinase [Adhaeribacter soli]
MLQVNKDIPNSEESMFSSLMFRFLPYWPLFAGLLVVSLFGAWGYLRYLSVPTYEVSASLLIKDEKKGINDPRMMEAIDAFASSKLVDNEIKVIQSRGLMNKVVDTLMLYAQVFEEDQFRSIPAYASSPVIIKVKNPERISEVPQVYFTFNEGTHKIKFQEKEYPLDEWVRTPYGIMLFQRNEKQSAAPIGPLYFSLIPTRQVTDGLLANLKIEPANKLSTVINITLEDPVPQRGEAILNNLIYAYDQAALNERNTLAANTMAFIEDRIKLIEKDLENVEEKVQQYKSSQGVVNLGEQSKLYLQSVGENDRKIADINIQLAVLQKVENYVISKNKATGIVPSTLGVNDPVLEQLLQKLYNAETQYNNLKNTTAENNPILLALADEIQKVRPGILENIRNQRDNLIASRAHLATTNSSFNVALQAIPKKEKELLEISRQQAIKNNAYSFLLQKREETALSHAPSAGDSRVVDLAESSILPVSPKAFAVYLMAVMAALGFGVSIIVGKEQLTGKILFRTDIEERTNVPIVIELSEVKRQKETLFAEPEEVCVIEQFRQMRATMGLFGRSFNRKKIMITSSVAGEGKSFVSTNLAYSLATSGKKVVLLDFDLRNPNTSLMFDLFKQNGIIEYLNDEVRLETIIRETSFKNLSVVPAGMDIGDHTELLLNGKLDELFEGLEKQFDYILVDTPPVELVSDAYLLSEYCDANLFIMRHGYTPKTKIKRLNQNPRLRAMNNLGIVFTAVKSRGFIKGDGYGYGYGYEGRYREKGFKTQDTQAKSQLAFFSQKLLPKFKLFRERIDG